MDRKAVIIDKNPKTQFRIGHNYPVLTNMDTLAGDIHRISPDWAFIFRKDAHEIIERNTKHIKKAYFIGDYRYPMVSSFLRFSHMCDVTLTTYKCKKVWAQLKNPKVVKMGTNPKFFHILPDVKQEYDVAFGGSNFGGEPRMKVLKFLEKNFNLFIVGNGWDGFKNTTPRKSLNGLNRHLQMAKITVGIFNRTDMVEQGVQYYTSNRLYQNMAIGIPHLAPYSPKVHEWFKYGYVEYKDLYELGQMIAGLLEKTPEELDLFGRVQQKEIRTRHTHEKSWEMIEKVVLESLYA